MTRKKEFIEIPFGAFDSELQEVTYYIPKGFHAEIDGDKIVIKKIKGTTVTTVVETGDGGINALVSRNLEDIKFKIGDVIKKDTSWFTITDITGGKYWYNDRCICDISDQDKWELSQCDEFYRIEQKEEVKK